MVASVLSNSRFYLKSRASLFAVLAVYLIFLLFQIGSNSVRWDELVHSLGAWQLLHGQFSAYLTTNVFYPPMFNFATAVFVGVTGPGVLSARLVSVTFSLLSLWILYEFANKMYGSKVALLSVIFFGVMPGVFWVSRFGYIETMLEFFFLASLFFFFGWLLKGNSKYLVMGGLALGLGFLVKYQILVAGLVMVAVLLVSGLSQLKLRLKRFSVIVLIVLAVAGFWFALVYAFVPATFSQWMYAISAGDQLRSVYSVRFPVPIFYLIEMTAPYPDVHPISLLLYLLGFAGLGLLLWRRKPEDKFLLVWFAVVYAVFTAISNRNWRYLMPLYPVLALSASVAVWSVYSKMKFSWQKTSPALRNKFLAKGAAIVLIAFTASAVFMSCIDAYALVSESGRFQDETTVGTAPDRIFILTFVKATA